MLIPRIAMNKMDDTRDYPLISVVMATYNGSSYIEEQLKSILGQTYPNIGIVVVDDASKDGTIEILNRYRQEYPNIDVYTNDQNLGYIKTFEKGISLAKGSFIALSDQDDVWVPAKLALLAEHIGRHLLIYSDNEYVDEHLKTLGHKLSDEKNMGDYDNCLVFVTDNCVAGHTCMMRRELFEMAYPFPATIPHDQWLAFIASMNGGVKYLDQPLVRYRIHGRNVLGVSAKAKKNAIAKPFETIPYREKVLNNLRIFYDRCNADLSNERKVIGELIGTYSGYSLPKNIGRSFTFFKNAGTLLQIKKKNKFRKFLFCLKMFVKVR
jgi:glycosyltransferase involved in cell wall biosynthesis